MAFTDWYVEGESFGNCNCGYSCPCQFEELPTHGDCRGFEVLEVTKGHFGDTDLSGTKAALIYAWPGPIFEGGGEMQVIVDPAATPAQRDALEKVFHGEETEEMATHWYVFRAMCETVHDTLYLPIEDAAVLTDHPATADYFEELVALHPHPREASNWVKNF